MPRLRGKHYRTGESLTLHCDHGVIARVEPGGTGPVEREADWLAPAFFDLQINGCEGISFNAATLTAEQIARVTAACHRHGVAHLLPTLVTNAAESLIHGFRTLAQARAGDPALARALVGYHLEGPYIAAEDGPRGAHPRAHVRPPDWDEFRRFQDAAEGLIRLVTLAPEVTGAIALIEKLAASGVVVALGHTAASATVIADAVKAGARLSTHLGNGCHAVLPRHDNHIWPQLADDRLWASLIADGHHLPPAVLRAMVRAKTPARLVLTCDAGSLAGCPPGVYPEWEQAFEVRPEGKIVVAGTNFLAGSWAFTDHCVRTLMTLDEMPWPDVIDLAGAQPRRLLGLPVVEIAAGMPADVILFDGPLTLRTTLVGNVLYDA